MKYLSVCSGIEAATAAWHRLRGWKPVAFAEIEAFPSAVLAHHHPGVPNLGDLSKFRDWPPAILAATDLLVGGTPCQSFSVAGLRGGLDDERGNLALTYIHLLGAIDHARSLSRRPPALCLWENVPGVFSAPGNPFGHFLAGLAGTDVPLQPPGDGWGNSGAVYGPRRAVAWRTLDAQFFGLAQRRERVFVIASPRDGPDPAALLFEFNGVRRDSPPSREAREGPPGSAEESTGSSRIPTIAGTLGGNRSNPKPGDPCHTLPAQTCAPILAHVDPVSPTLLSGPSSPASHGKQSGSDRTSLVASLALRGREGGNLPELGGDLAHALRGADGGSSKPHVLTSYAVRRLTPRECERLQGFPDDHTAIPWRGKAPEACPDSPRYKAIGNSMAVPVMLWIGRRIHATTRQGRTDAATAQEPQPIKPL